MNCTGLLVVSLWTCLVPSGTASAHAGSPSSTYQETIGSQAPQGHVEGSNFLYRGYRFDIGKMNPGTDQEAFLQAIQQQTDIVESTSLSDETKAFLRSRIVHVSEGEGEGGGHINKNGVFLFLRARPDDRPILLHEFMHAYQATRLPGGMQNKDMQMFYERAKSSGVWPANSYMLSNIAEFFAMTASTYLYGHTARPPFTRDAIQQKQPAYAAWLARNVR